MSPTSLNAKYIEYIHGLNKYQSIRCFPNDNTVFEIYLEYRYGSFRRVIDMKVLVIKKN